jgi:hypothetical protein
MTASMLVRYALEEHPSGPLPWKQIKYAVCQMAYGGRIGSAWDQQLLSNLFDRCMSQEAMEEGFCICPGAGWRLAFCVCVCRSSHPCVRACVRVDCRAAVHDTGKGLHHVRVPAALCELSLQRPAGSVWAWSSLDKAGQWRAGCPLLAKPLRSK